MQISKERSNMILTIGSWIFVIALIPAVISSQPPAAATCVLTAAVLAAFAAVYALNSWKGAAATTALSSLLWIVLLVEALS